MKEKEIHKLIEQQDMEIKQRIWKKIKERLKDEQIFQTENKNDTKRNCKAKRRG